MKLEMKSENEVSERKSGVRSDASMIAWLPRVSEDEADLTSSKLTVT